MGSINICEYFSLFTSLSESMLHKKLKFLRVNMVLATIFVVSFAFSVSFAADILSRTLEYSAATLRGTSDSQIVFST